MDKYANLLQVLKNAVNVEAVPLMMAEVVEITGESCTVRIDDLELTDVRLKATINDSDDRLLIIPKVGSIVIVGSLTGDLKDLTVIKCDEVDTIDYKQNGLNLLIDAKDGKISLSSGEIDFFQIMNGLVSLLKGFKVYTPAGPSGTPLPTTLQQLADFENGLKSIFK